MANPNVTILVLNYNRCEDTMECIHSLRKCSYPSFRVIVIDNASTDNSEQRLRKEFPEIEVIQTGRNRGYAGGINAGMRHALSGKPDYALVLNNDVLVDSSFLSHLVDAMENHPEAGAACGTIFYYPETEKIWYAGGRFIWWRASGFSDHSLESTRPNEVKRVSFVTGCMILFRVAPLQEIGLFDERFFMYLEDTDVGLRLQNRGYSLLYVPQARIYHKVAHEGDKPLPLYYSVRNRLLLSSLSLNGWKKTLAQSYLLTVFAVKMLMWSVVNVSLFRAARYGIEDYFKGRFYEGRGLLIG